MALISDIFLASGAFGAAIYCFVLSRRLTRFTQLESGMGGAIAVLSAQVDDMTRALERARETAQASSENLDQLSLRAEQAAGRLELLLASMHDLPEAASGGTTPEFRTSGSAANHSATGAFDPTERKLRFVRRRMGRTTDEAETEGRQEAAE